MAALITYLLPFASDTDSESDCDSVSRIQIQFLALLLPLLVHSGLRKCRLPLQCLLCGSSFVVIIVECFI